MKKKLKWNSYLKKRWGTIIIDIVIALIIVSVVLLELFKNDKDSQSENNTEIFINLIFTLLPLIINIIAIAISLRSEKTFGLTMTDINRLRGSFYFDFLHMIFISIFSICTGVILSFFNFKASLSLLSIISVFYAIYFSVEEIPLLIQSQKYFSWIIKRAIKRKNNSNEENELLQITYTNYVLECDIEQACNYLLYKKCGNNTSLNFKVFNDLLDAQNKYFEEVMRNLKISKTISLSGNNSDISVLKTINKGYKNIEISLLDSPLDIELGPTSMCSIKKATIILHNLCGKLDYLNIEVETMANILHEFFLCNNTDDKSDKDKFKCIEKYICLISIASLLNGEVYFLKYLLTLTMNPYFAFDLKNTYLGLLLSMFVAKITEIDFRYLSENNKVIISNFLTTEISTKLVGNVTWSTCLINYVELGDPDKLIESLQHLLDLYEELKDLIYDYNSKFQIMNASNIFSNQTILDYWLQIMLYAHNCSYDFKEEIVKQTIEKLDPNVKRILFMVFDERFYDVKKNGPKKDDNANFIKTYNLNHGIDSSYCINQEIFDCIVGERNNWVRQIDVSGYENNKDNEDNKFKEKLNDYLSKNELIDENVEESSYYEYHFCYLIDIKQQNNALVQLANVLVLKIENQIQDYISSNSNSISCNNSKEMFEILNEKNPYFRSTKSKAFMYFNLCEEDKNKLRSYKKLYLYNFLPCDFYGRKNSLKIHFKIDKTKPILKELTDDEAERIIDEGYKISSNGLYYYATFENDQRNATWINRTRLKEVLMKTKLLLDVTYYLVIEIDKDNCFRFEINRKD